jgi:hypothetical protein
VNPQHICNNTDPTNKNPSPPQQIQHKSVPKRTTPTPTAPKPEPNTNTPGSTQNHRRDLSSTPETPPAAPKSEHHHRRNPEPEKTRKSGAGPVVRRTSSSSSHHHHHHLGYIVRKLFGLEREEASKSGFELERCERFFATVSREMRLKKMSGCRRPEILLLRELFLLLYHFWGAPYEITKIFSIRNLSYEHPLKYLARFHFYNVCYLNHI